MSRHAQAARQGTLKGVLPPNTPAQNAALTYAETLDQLQVVKDRAQKQQDEMLRAAAAEKVDTVKVRDSLNYVHTFTIEDGKTKVGHKKTLEVKIEHAADELKA